MISLLLRLSDLYHVLQIIFGGIFKDLLWMYVVIFRMADDNFSSTARSIYIVARGGARRYMGGPPLNFIY